MKKLKKYASHMDTDIRLRLDFTQIHSMSIPGYMDQLHEVSIKMN